MQPGSTVKNTDLGDRGFFLGSALKHIDEAIWAKIDKYQYMRSFAKIGAEVSFEDVTTVWSAQILAEQIEQKFSEDESAIH